MLKAFVTFSINAQVLVRKFHLDSAFFIYLFYRLVDLLISHNLSLCCITIGE